MLLMVRKKKEKKDSVIAKSTGRFYKLLRISVYYSRLCATVCDGVQNIHKCNF